MPKVICHLHSRWSPVTQTSLGKWPQKYFSMKGEQRRTRAGIFILPSIFSASFIPYWKKKPIEIIASLWPAAVEQTHATYLKMFSNITATTLRKGTLVIKVLGIAFSILRQIIHLFVHLQCAVLFTFLVGFPETCDGHFQKHFVGGLPSFLLQSRVKVPLIFSWSKEPQILVIISSYHRLLSFWHHHKIFVSKRTTFLRVIQHIHLHISFIIAISKYRNYNLKHNRTNY